MKKYIVAFLLSHVYLLLSGTVSPAQKPGTPNNYDTLLTEDNSSSVIFDSPSRDTVLQRFTFTGSYDSINAFKSGKDFRYMKYLDSFLKHT